MHLRALPGFGVVLTYGWRAELEFSFLCNCWGDRHSSEFFRVSWRLSLLQTPALRCLDFNASGPGALDLFREGILSDYWGISFGLQFPLTCVPCALCGRCPMVPDEHKWTVCTEQSYLLSPGSFTPCSPASRPMHFCCSPCLEHNKNSPFVTLFCWAQLIPALFPFWHVYQKAGNFSFEDWGIVPNGWLKGDRLQRKLLYWEWQWVPILASTFSLDKVH